MKTHTVAAILAAALMAQACTPLPAPSPRPTPSEPGRGDECPRADGLPCR